MNLIEKFLGSKRRRSSTYTPGRAVSREAEVHALAVGLTEALQECETPRNGATDAKFRETLAQRLGEREGFTQGASLTAFFSLLDAHRATPARTVQAIEDRMQRGHALRADTIHLIRHKDSILLAAKLAGGK
jgi:hypothetical protein